MPGTMADLETLLRGKRDFGRVLDIGCGQGYAFPFIDQHLRPDFLLGIDIDANLVKRGEALV